MFSKIFSPKTNFYNLLNRQAETTLAGMIALAEFVSGGAAPSAQKVRDYEQKADDQKLDLEKKLVESFVTPFDREDIYDISFSLDEVINSAKSMVREIEALEIEPKDAMLQEMVVILVEGTRCLVNTIALLEKNLQEAAEQAVLARKSDKRLAKVYRHAMKELFLQEDCKVILKTRELYSCLLDSGDRIDRLGEMLIHVIVKMT